jgi:hypothetical protein
VTPRNARIDAIDDELRRLIDEVAEIRRRLLALRPSSRAEEYLALRRDLYRKGARIGELGAEVKRMAQSCPKGTA